MPTGAECEPCINSSPLYACGYKGINEANKVEKKYCPGKEECYKVSLSACSNAKSSCQSYKTNGGNLLIELLEPTLIALPANFYNQISKYCCGESSGNNEGWIRINANQEIKRTDYTKINFNMSKGYTPSRITIKPLGGSTPDSLNYLTHSCSPRDDYQTCYYKFKDFSLSSTDTRQRRVTITAEKDEDSSKKISA